MRSAKKKLFEAVIEIFSRTMPQANSELNFSNTYQLLVAVMLSAQCTDKRVNMVTPKLLADYPTPEAMAVTTSEVIFEYIKSVSYPNNKAKHLVGMANKLVTDFGTYELKLDVKEAKILINNQLFIKAGDWNVSLYPSFVEFLTKVTDTYGSKIVLRKKV